MSTANADRQWKCLLDIEVANPLGHHLERGAVEPGAMHTIWVDEYDDGERVLTVDQTPMSVETARELAEALTAGIQAMEASR